jgi:hypothetical protein
LTGGNQKEKYRRGKELLPVPPVFFSSKCYKTETVTRVDFVKPTRNTYPKRPIYPRAGKGIQGTLGTAICRRSHYTKPQPTRYLRLRGLHLLSAGIFNNHSASQNSVGVAAFGVPYGIIPAPKSYFAAPKA